MKNAKVLEYETKQKNLEKVEQTKREINRIAGEIIVKYKDELIQSVEDEVVNCINEGENSLCYDNLIYDKLGKICESNYKSIERYTKDFNKISDIVGMALVEEIENHGYYYYKSNDYEFSYIFWNKKYFIIKRITNNLIIKLLIILITSLIIILIINLFFKVFINFK